MCQKHILIKIKKLGVQHKMLVNQMFKGNNVPFGKHVQVAW